jgi:integrase/recombinase XerC
MAHLRLKKGNYYAEFYDPLRHPTRKWVPLRLRDKQAARSKLVNLERLYGNGDYDPWEQEAPLAGVGVVDAVNAYVKARGDRRRDTTSTDRTVLMNFASTLPAGAQLEHVEPRHVRNFLNKPKKDGESRAAATREIYLARIKTFFSWSMERGWRRGKNPADKVTSPKVGKKMPLFLSRDDYDALLTAIEGDAAGKKKRVENGGEILWLADVIRVTTGTGLRASELCHLRWSAVDLSGRRLKIQASKGFAPKSYHERSVPLAGEALDVLQRLESERGTKTDGYVFTGRATRKGTKPHLDRQYVNKRFKHYAEKAELNPDHTFHSLRRTYASWLVQGGTDLYVVQKLLGHADIKTTMKYAFLAPDNLVSAVNTVFG